MEVRWSLPAAEDLERICERIERDNPEAARRVARSIYDGCAHRGELRCQRFFRPQASPHPPRHRRHLLRDPSRKRLPNGGFSAASGDTRCSGRIDYEEDYRMGDGTVRSIGAARRPFFSTAGSCRRQAAAKDPARFMARNPKTSAQKTQKLGIPKRYCNSTDST